MMTYRVLPALLLTAAVGLSVPAGEPVPKDLQPLQGTWAIQADVVDGIEFPKDLLEKSQIIIAGDKMTQKPEIVNENGTFKFGNADGFTASFELDASKDPRHFDVIVTDGGQKFRANGIYAVEKDTLRICFNPKDRPKDFTSKAGSGNILLTLKRAKK